MSDFNIPFIPDYSAIEKRMKEMTIQSKNDSPIHHIWASEQFRFLQKYIQDFERTLDSEHEVGLMLTNFGQSITMQVTQITYEEPVLMVFRGFVNGQEATLIQHINQLNFLLTSVIKEEDRPKRKIGFTAELQE